MFLGLVSFEILGAPLIPSLMASNTLLKIVSVLSLNLFLVPESPKSLSDDMDKI